MGKFCTSCGAALNEGAKFCAKCGAKVSPVSEESVAQPDPETPKRETFLSNVGKKVKDESEESVVQPDPETPKRKTFLSKVGKKVKDEAKVKATEQAAKVTATEYAKSTFTDAISADQSSGEFSLPSDLAALADNLSGEGLLSLLKGGLQSLVSGFKSTLGDKKRLTIVIALAVVWLVVNLLYALDISPFPLRVISWLTAARGSLVGGSVAKGLLASLLAQLIMDKGTLQKLKDGLGRLTAVVKDGKKDYAPLLLGAGAGLFASNLMAVSSLQNTMACIAGFALSAMALTQNGFLRRFATALLPKANSSVITTVMGGWTLGFALFAAVSFLPGRKNGYLIGVLLLIVGGILAVTAKNSNKEVSAR